MRGHSIQLEDFSNSSLFESAEPTSSSGETPRLTDDFGFSGPNLIGESEEQMKVCRFLIIILNLWVDDPQNEIGYQSLT